MKSVFSLLKESSKVAFRVAARPSITRKTGCGNGQMLCSGMQPGREEAEHGARGVIEVAVNVERVGIRIECLHEGGQAVGEQVLNESHVRAVRWERWRRAACARKSALRMV